MRHLWSAAAGAVAAPVAWLLLATGQHRAQATVTGWEGTFHTGDLVGPVSLLVLAGLLLGLVGTLRWSPAGPLAAGVLLVLPTVFMFGNPLRTLDAFRYDEQNRLFGQDFALWLPVWNGTLLVIGVLLLMAVFSRQRWRRWPTPPPPIPPATDDEVVAGIDALTREPTGATPLTDDEILAAAAAYEQADTLGEAVGPEPGPTGPPDEPAPPDDERSGSTG